MIGAFIVRSSGRIAVKFAAAPVNDWFVDLVTVTRSQSAHPMQPVCTLCYQQTFGPLWVQVRWCCGTQGMVYRLSARPNHCKWHIWVKCRNIFINSTHLFRDVGLKFGCTKMRLRRRVWRSAVGATMFLSPPVTVNQKGLMSWLCMLRTHWALVRTCCRSMMLPPHDVCDGLPSAWMNTAAGNSPMTAWVGEFMKGSTSSNSLSRLWALASASKTVTIKNFMTVLCKFQLLNDSWKSIAGF